MIVHFEGKSAQYHPTTGLKLEPGDNEVSDEQGAALVAAGVVKKPKKVTDEQGAALIAAGVKPAKKTRKEK